jgi:uncharacterized protein YlzI (FlbEa/FlbD family)
MIKVTSRRMGEMVLNPAAIESVRPVAREHGAEIILLSGHRHEVTESVEQVFQKLEDVRHA